MRAAMNKRGISAGPAQHSVDPVDAPPIRFPPFEVVQVAGVYVYQPPQQAVAQAIAAGQDLDLALGGWRDMVTPLVAAFQADRRHVVFANTADLVADPDKVLQRLREAGQSLSAHQEATLRAAIPVAYKQDPLLELIAMQAVHSDPKALRLWRELQAATISAGQTATLDLQRVQHSLGDMRSLRTTATLADRQQAELGQLTETLATKETHMRQAQNRNEASLKELAQTRQTLSQRDARLQQLQACVDDFARSSAELQAQMVELEDALETREADVKAMMASRSWRVTAPLRFIGRRFGTGT